LQKLILKKGETYMTDSPPIIWMTGVTADHAIDVNVNTRAGILNSLSRFGLQGLEQAIANPNRDYELRCDNPDTWRGVVEEVKKITREYNRSQVGGSPAIAALAGIVLGEEVHYGGNIGRPAVNALDKSANGQYDQFVEGNPITDHSSETIALELLDGSGKVMLSHSEGRGVSDLNMDSLQVKISNLYEIGNGTILALAGLNKGEPEAYRTLVDVLRQRRSNTHLFVGTNSFGSDEESIEKARQYWDAIIGQADIISMNEQEASAVYKALDGEEAEATVVEMVQYIDQKTDGMVVVHTSAGAVASTNGFDKDDVQYALEMAVSGATYRYKEGKFGDKKEITNFAKSNGLAHDAFAEKVGVAHTQMPGDITYAVAHDLSREQTNGNLTGAGATFDGTLLAHLALLYKED
jgi:sugar/nucleoside kinase (ribokinase family)